MATIRVEKDNNFTIIKNNIFLEKNISLKAKGLLTQMLSLPDSWDYTVAGLATLCKDGRDSITSALKELEQYGYVTRTRIRDEKGMLKDIEYIIREVPVPTVSNKPVADFPELDSSTRQKPMTDFPELDSNTHQKPIMDSPELDKPNLEEPVAGKNTQLSTKQLNNDISNTQSYQSIGKLEEITNKVKTQISYDDIINFNPSSKKMCDEIVNILVETYLSNRPQYRLNQSDVSSILVKQRFQSLTSDHIYYVINQIQSTTNSIKNMHQYMFTALFNAPTTCSCYFIQKAQSDMAEGRC